MCPFAYTTVAVKSLNFTFQKIVDRLNPFGKRVDLDILFLGPSSGILLTLVHDGNKIMVSWKGDRFPVFRGLVQKISSGGHMMAKDAHTNGPICFRSVEYFLNRVAILGQNRNSVARISVYRLYMPCFPCIIMHLLSFFQQLCEKILCKKSTEEDRPKIVNPGLTCSQV